MKKDLELLMKKHNADALWISGAANHNPTMYYFTGGIHVTGGDLLSFPVKNRSFSTV